MFLKTAGPKTIQKWISLGYRTLDDLIRNRHTALTHQTTLGVLYYDEINSRIPREEVSKIEAVVKAVAADIDPELHLVTCGSYRRGKSTCGDVDILLTHPKGYPVSASFYKILKRLEETGFLTDHLVSLEPKNFINPTAVPANQKPISNHCTYMGIFQLQDDSEAAQAHSQNTQLVSSDTQHNHPTPIAPEESSPDRATLGIVDLDECSTEFYAPQVRSSPSSQEALKPQPLPFPAFSPNQAQTKPTVGHQNKSHNMHRRFDMRAYPIEQFPTALLYFTGSDHFNRSMRLFAKKHGFQLSDQCVRRRPVEGMEGEPIPVTCEKDVFRVLGLVYKEPTERSI